MAKIFENVLHLIGETPLLELTSEKKGVRILAKLERFNPAGSTKDRVALGIIQRAEEERKLTSGGTIIEATSGNTGVGLAMVAAVRGYKAVIVMPTSMSEERKKLIAVYGAELVLTDGALGMSGAIKKAEEIHAQTPNSIIADQFRNTANTEAHYRTTGPEIWRDTDGEIDVLVSCVGSGGTISGAGRYLKEQNSTIRIIAVEPDASALLSGGTAAPHKIQGIGANFIPEILDREIYDEVIRVRDDEAFSSAKQLAKTDGLLVGVSSGAAVFAARKIAQSDNFVGKTIVVILPDTGERYLSIL